MKNTERIRLLYQNDCAFNMGIIVGKKEMIEKARQWIISNMPKYVKAYQLDVFINNEDMANDFKRAMEE